MTRAGLATILLTTVPGVLSFLHPSLVALRYLVGPIAGAAIQRIRGGDGLRGAVAGGVVGAAALILVDAARPEEGPIGLSILLHGGLGLLGITATRLGLQAAMAAGFLADPIGVKEAAERRTPVWVRAIERARRPRP